MKKSFQFKSFLPIGIATLLIASASTFEPGCTKKSTATPVTDTLSSVTIASSISSLVTSPQSGIAPQAESNAQMFQNMSFTCGTIVDTSFSGNETTGGMTINYSLSYADTGFCTSGTLTKMDFYMNNFMDMSMTGMYFGGKNKTFMSMSGLDAGATNYVMTETCTGTDTIKENTSSASLTCYMNMNYSATNITISKSLGQIISGNASIQYSYVTSGGNSYNESATVKYLGSMQAVITLANGYTTTVSW